jgi:hypothetical protein
MLLNKSSFTLEDETDYEVQGSIMAFEFEIRSLWGVIDTTLCDKVCQRLATGVWFSPGAIFQIDFFAC